MASGWGIAFDEFQADDMLMECGRRCDVGHIQTDMRIQPLASDLAQGRIPESGYMMMLTRP